MNTRILASNGLKVVADKSEYYPDDPGAGTPLMVYYGSYSATYECAVNEGELSGNRGYRPLTHNQLAFLNSNRVVSNLVGWVYN